MNGERAGRVKWRDSVASPAFPAELRIVRGTLLCLVPLMNADGTLAVTREAMTSASGLPVRTLNRHLSQAVDSGWLQHEVRAGNGRLARYLAVVPDRELWAMSGAQLGRVVGHSLVNNSTGVVGHLVAHSNKDRASVSEREALDPKTPPQLEGHATSAYPHATATELRTDKPSHPLLALDVAKRITCWECNLLGTQDENNTPCEPHRQLEIHL